MGQLQSRGHSNWDLLPKTSCWAKCGMERPTHPLRLSWVCTPRALFGVWESHSISVYFCGLTLSPTFCLCQVMLDPWRISKIKACLFLSEQYATLPYWTKRGPRPECCCRGSVSGSVPLGDWTFCALLSAPQVHTFRGPHWCEYCANFMWGLIAQGVRCSGRHKTLSSSRYIKCHLVEWEATFRARDCAWMSSEIQLV